MATVAFANNYPRGESKKKEYATLKKTLDYMRADNAYQIQLLNGQNGSAAAHFRAHVDAYGVVDPTPWDADQDPTAVLNRKMTSAKLSFDEQSSMVAAMQAAVDQACAIHG